MPARNMGLGRYWVGPYKKAGYGPLKCGFTGEINRNTGISNCDKIQQENNKEYCKTVYEKVLNVCSAGNNCRALCTTDYESIGVSYSLNECS